MVRDYGPKPEKPHKDFPLTASGNGQWCKKIGGRMFYFGKWDDPQAALANYNKQLPHILDTGDKQEEVLGGTLRDLCNAFLTYKQSELDSGEINQRSFDDYHDACERLLKGLGKDRQLAHLRPSDFRQLRAKLVQRDDCSGARSLVSLGNHIRRMTTVLNFGFDDGYFARPKSQVMGRNFKQPDKASLRREKLGKPKKLFTAEQIHRLLDKASPHMRAMILLGVNAGYGNTDIAELRPEQIKNGWIEHPRPKTAVERRTPLWPETLEALSEITAGGNYLFEKDGRSFHQTPTHNPITSEFRDLLKEVGIYRKGVGFYALRHTFQTVADGSRDRVAVSSLMGHVDNSMAGTYVESIDDERLKEVTDFARSWFRSVFR